ncbi:MAG: superoxide dismutase [Bacteroidetes bacterium]|nr:superoxide dismutase [Bacteroidota bacterium]MBS1757058.1 superoxide dismutase [Bacteroidota bacterium]
MKKKSGINRRDFIFNTAKTSIGLTLGLSALSNYAMANDNQKILTTKFDTGFDQKPLPYAYDALENVIDALTMEIHYTKHAAGYSKNLKEAVTTENVPLGTSVEKILSNISSYSTKMRNNAGGHYNHEMFWQCMQPKSLDNKPKGKLMEAIEKHFTSFENFKIKFDDAAKTRFGSGWAWLYADNNHNLHIGSTPNQDNPLMNISEIKGFPLLGLDVWEHAYYLMYQNKRAEYVENWWKLVNWDYVSNRYASI